MDISKDRIEHIAKLAKIDFSSEEKEKFFKEFSQILDFVGKLNEADVPRIESFVTSEVAGIAREDEAAPKNEESVKKIMSNVPEKEGNLIKTKKIF